MSAEEIQLEIAHCLFIDIIGSSERFSALSLRSFCFTKNVISASDAWGSLAFSGNDGTKFAKKLNSFFWSADFTEFQSVALT